MPTESPLTLEEAREILSTEKLEFGNDRQIEAVNKLDASGARSNAQVKRWIEKKIRFVKMMSVAMSAEIYVCKHCGRVPWAPHLSPVCAGKILKQYELGETFPGKWLSPAATEWFASHKAGISLTATPLLDLSDLVKE